MNVEDHHAKALLRAAEDALLVAAAQLQEAVVAVARSPVPPSKATVARARTFGALIESSLRKLGPALPTRASGRTGRAR